MKKIILFFLNFVFAFANEAILNEARIENILAWGKADTLKLGEYFTYLQSEWFSTLFLLIIIALPSVFALHYMIIGPKVFKHDGKKIFVFSFFIRVIHWIAAFSWIILIPTGLIMIFGDFFGGGAFVRFAKNLHGIGTIIFAIVITPMWLIWFKDMFPRIADLKWLMICGGYLSKEKKPVPSYKFNMGQKMWYWTCGTGGFLMIFTGAQMFFLGHDIFFLSEIFGISHISVLRLSAIIHNGFGILCVAMFITHTYMATFAIKGAIHSMIDGYKEEDEVKHLHSLWYKQLIKSK